MVLDIAILQKPMGTISSLGKHTTKPHLTGDIQAILFYSKI